MRQRNLPLFTVCQPSQRLAKVQSLVSVAELENETPVKDEDKEADAEGKPAADASEKSQNPLDPWLRRDSAILFAGKGKEFEVDGVDQALDDYADDQGVVYPTVKKGAGAKASADTVLTAKNAKSTERVLASIKSPETMVCTHCAKSLVITSRAAICPGCSTPVSRTVSVMPDAMKAKVQHETEHWRNEVKELAPDFLNVGENERIVSRGGRTGFAECRRKYIAMHKKQVLGRCECYSFEERWENG